MAKFAKSLFAASALALSASVGAWPTKPVTFVSGTGSVALEDVPAGTTSISAKTAWTLRSKVSAPLSAEGVGSADLTGTFELKGGDLNNDNVIITLDYSILRYNWMTVAPAANISGDSAGGVNTSDYTILNANFYSVGSAE